MDLNCPQCGQEIPRHVDMCHWCQWTRPEKSSIISDIFWIIVALIAIKLFVH